LFGAAGWSGDFPVSRPCCMLEGFLCCVSFRNSLTNPFHLLAQLDRVC
jgi:hypothetical protein